MERCPNCRARLVAGEVACHRCGMELHWLLRTEQAAAQELRQAAEHWANGDLSRACTALRRTRHLRRDPLIEQLLRACRCT
jgi:hypothetical protein